jgi:carbon storage regulator
MLKLTRRQGESIMIGDEIEIVIGETRSDRVIIGIAAPEDVAVHRKEYYEKIKKDGQGSEVQQHKKISVDQR